MKITK